LSISAIGPVPGLGIARWRHDRNDPGLASELATEQCAARLVGFEETPSFLLGPTGVRPTVKLALTVSQCAWTHPTALTRGIERLLR
jgi:hypothetical protein